jgi:hypothetical protein
MTTPPPAAPGAAEAQAQRLLDDYDIHWPSLRASLIEALAAAHLAGQLAMRERCAQAVDRRLRERFGPDGDRYAQSAVVAIRALDPEPAK